MSDNPSSEKEVIERCRHGDRAAFRWLVEQYGQEAYRVAYLQTLNPDLAEDLTQEAFIDAWRGLRSFDPERPFRPWFLKIVMNRCRMFQRKTRVTSIPLDETLVVQGESASFASPDAGISLRQALSRLDFEDRLLITLRYFADMTIPQIAEALALPEGTIKSRIHRILEKLRASLT